MLLCHEGMGIHVHTWTILGCHSRIISWCLGHKCSHAHHAMQYVPWLFALLTWVCMFTYDLCFCSILGQHKPMWARPQHRATVAWAHIFNATHLGNDLHLCARVNMYVHSHAEPTCCTVAVYVFISHENHASALCYMVWHAHSHARLHINCPGALCCGGPHACSYLFFTGILWQLVVTVCCGLIP